MTALHPAFCMITVFKIRSAAIEAMVTVNFWFQLGLIIILTGFNNKKSCTQHNDQDIWRPFFVHKKIFYKLKVIP
jgi:hypothetical protein